MNDEIVTKKLALFYHPLFQAIIREWIPVFQIHEDAIDIITFIDINLRIQKAILSQIQLDNSFSSAVTDWIRELESLMINGPFQTPEIKDFDTVQAFKNLLEVVPFELSTSIDQYLVFLCDQMHRLDTHFITDKISFSGFAKFLFDLCYSWCEELDIELFVFFLIAVLYQMTHISFPTPKMKDFDQIMPIPEQLITQIKLRKAHYNRYKKVDITSYEAWYEWNYLPNRINEIKTKVIDIFCSTYKENPLISPYLEGTFKTALQQIIQRDLIKPTSVHFTILPKDNEKQKTEFDLTAESGGMCKLNNLKNIPPSTHSKKVIKRMAIPIFGKTLVKVDSVESNHVHTLKSIQSFLGDIDSTLDEKGVDFKKQTQLYPIWEHEFSETASVATGTNSEKTNSLKLNKEIRNFSSTKAKRSFSALKRKDEKSFRTATLWAHEIPLDKQKNNYENSNSSPSCFPRNFMPKGRLSLSPPLFDQNKKMNILSPTNMANHHELQAEKKGSIITQEKDTKTGGRTSAPAAKSKLRMTLSSANLFKEVLGEIASTSKRRGGDSKVSKYFGKTPDNLNKSSTATLDKHRGRIFKEMSFEESSITKSKALNFTIVGKSTFATNEDDIINSPSEKYALHLNFTEAGENEKIIKNEKVEYYSLKKKMNGENLQKYQSSRYNKSPFREVVSPSFEERKKKANNRLNELIKDSKKDSFGYIRIEFPKTTGHKPAFKTIKQVLDNSIAVVDKEQKDLFGKMQEKVMKNKKNQEIRMKRVKRPQLKRISHLQTSEDDNNESVSPDLMHNFTENLLG